MRLTICRDTAADTQHEYTQEELIAPDPINVFEHVELDAFKSPMSPEDGGFVNLSDEDDTAHQFQDDFMDDFKERESVPKKKRASSTAASPFFAPDQRDIITIFDHDFQLDPDYFLKPLPEETKHRQDDDYEYTLLVSLSNCIFEV